MGWFTTDWNSDKVLEEAIAKNDQKKLCKIAKKSEYSENREEAVKNIDDIFLLSEISDAYYKEHDNYYIDVIHTVNECAIEIVRQITDKETLEKLQKQCSNDFNVMFMAQIMDLESKLCNHILGLLGGQHELIPFLSKKEDLKKVIRKFDGEAGDFAAYILVQRTDDVKDLEQLKIEFKDKYAVTSNIEDKINSKF